MGGGGDLRVVVMVEDSRFRIACKSGSTIEWLLDEAASRYTAALKKVHGAQPPTMRADALLTGDGSFLDPLDLVADVCEPDEVLIAVLSVTTVTTTTVAARSPLNVEQMVLRLKTLASDSSTSNSDSAFEPDDVLGGSLAPAPPPPHAVLAAAAAADAAFKRSSPLGREVRGGADLSESSSDLTNTPSPAALALSGSHGASGASANAAATTNTATNTTAPYELLPRGESDVAVAIEDSLDVARKRLLRGGDQAKDKLPESSPSFIAVRANMPSSMLGTSAENSLSKVRQLGRIPSTSSEALPKAKHADDSDDSELAMAINVEVPTLGRRLTFDVLVDETCADVVRKVQLHLPSIQPPAGHRFTLQLANGTVCGVGKTMIDLHVQPRELVTLVAVKIADANKEAPQRGELLRKVNELDAVVLKKQQSEQAADKQPDKSLKLSPGRAPIRSSPPAADGSAASPKVPPAAAAALAAAATTKDSASPKQRRSHRNSNEKTAMQRRPSFDKAPIDPVSLRRPSFDRVEPAADVAAAAAVAAAAPVVDKPARKGSVGLRPSGSMSSLPLSSMSSPSASVDKSEAADETTADAAKRKNAGFFGRIKDSLTGKASKSRVSRLVTVPHLSLMETVQFSLKQTVGEVLEEFAATFGMTKQAHSAAERAALLEPWTIFLTEVSDNGTEQATELDKAALFSAYANSLDHCNLSVRRRGAATRPTSRSASHSDMTSIAANGAPQPPAPTRVLSDTLSSSNSSQSAMPMSPAHASDSGGGSGGAAVKKSKKGSKRSSATKSRPRAASPFEQALPPPRPTLSDESLRSPSSNTDDTSPRVELTGAIAHIKESMAKTAASSPDATTAALQQQNESLRSMLAQTLDRLERATARLSDHQTRDSHSSSSMSPQRALSPSQAASLLSPRSSSNLLRNSMLMRSISPDRGMRAPRFSDSDDERKAAAASPTSSPALTDDESERRRHAVLAVQRPPALMRYESFPPPPMAAPTSALAKTSLAASSVPATTTQQRKARAGSDVVPVDNKVHVRADHSDTSDSDSDSMAGYLLSLPLQHANTDAVHWRGARAVLSSTRAPIVPPEPPEWVFTSADDEPGADKLTMSHSDKTDLRRRRQRERRRRNKRAGARNELLRSRSDVPGSVMQRELDEKLASVATNRAQRFAALKSPLAKSAPNATTKAAAAAAAAAERELAAAMPLDAARMNEANMRECLFESGHTSVYRCVVRGATFTCKVFRSAAATRGEREAAWREVSILATLSHRNVVQFAGQQVVGNELRLFVEFFLTTLADVLAIRRDANESLSVADVTLFSLEIARALRYLHMLDVPVALLCLAPADVFYQANDYTGDVVLKIGAFAEARRVAPRTDEALSDTSLSASSTASSPTLRPQSGAFAEIADTLPSGWYNEMSRRRGARAAIVAPELHTLERTSITLRSDIWSFGMLMFELLFLRTPYEHERVELYDIARLVERGVAPQMADSQRAAQPAFQPLIRTLMRCFSVSPAERPNAQRLSRSLTQLRKVVVSR